MATIKNTQSNGVAALSVSVGNTEYYYLYSAAVGNMPKFLQVEIGDTAIPVHFELSDVVETITAYALGLDEDKFTGVFVCVGKESKKMDFEVRARTIINAINNAIQQAVDRGCFDGNFESATESEIKDAAVSITSHFYGMNQGRKTRSTAGYRGKANNRRYPHTCTITRYDNNDPMADQAVTIDDPMFDELIDDLNGDSGSDSSNAENTGVVTVYDGECRSEAKLTTTDAGDVLASTRRLSIPLTLDDWEKMEYKPKEADRVDVWKGDSYHEYGLIIDVMLGQLGTTILFKYVK